MPPAPNLKPGGGGGTFDSMSVIDAKIAASEARTDTKFSEVMGELRLINQRLGHVDDSVKGTRLNTWLAAATALGLALAAMALGSSQFGNGVMVTTAAVEDASQAKKIAQENAEEVRALRQDITTFMQAIQQQRPTPNQ